MVRMSIRRVRQNIRFKPGYFSTVNPVLFFFKKQLGLFAKGGVFIAVHQNI